MSISDLLILVSIVAYVALNSFVGYRIRKSLYLEETRRKLHLKLIWYLPFLGPLIIRNFWKKQKNEPLETITKDKRKIKKGSFYESGIGMHDV